ncbi:MAG: nucleotide disphospho-sugar-binding domain-containing protein [Bacteroidota bacterium]
MQRTAVLMSIGTRGDVEPFLALAEIFLAHDWRVVTVFPEQFRADAQSLDVIFVGFDRAFLEMLHAADGKTLMGGKGSRWQRIKSLYRLAKQGSRLSRQMMTTQHQVLHEYDPELTIFHPKCLYGVVWGRGRGGAIAYSPVPVNAHPVDEIGPTFRDDGRWINRRLLHLTVWARALAIRKYARSFFNSYPGVSFGVRDLVRTFRTELPTYYAVSPTLFPRPQDWPASAQVTGFHERDKTLDWQPTPELLSFLEQHAAPVLITFGSMTNAEPAVKTRLIVNVLRRENIPAIINCSEGGLTQLPDAPEHVFFVNRIPYDWAFLRVDCVVHHGGSGTTHTALKYGRPAMIVPHIIDQFFWNRTLARRGLGPLGPSMRKLTTENFATGLSLLRTEQDYREKVQQVSAQMATEPVLETVYHSLVDRMR